MYKKLSHKLPLLISLMHDGEFHDGTALGKSLKMTRSAIWKMIKKLERYGIKIQSIKGKGYALSEPLILLEDAAIRAHLNDKKLRIHLLETVDSTNDFLKSLRVLKNTQFCLAEQQTAGRGRLGRDWFSPFAENIYMSCLHPFNKDLSELAGLSLVVSLAVMRALQQFGVAEEVHVKWPNDILCEGKKISGILIDVQAESHGACHAIIGIGVNVNMRHDDAVKITQPWTSMREAGGEYVDRNKAAAALMNHLQDYLQRFEKEGFAAFIKEWEEAEGMSGKMISVKTQQETIRGQAAGINAQGHLLVKLQDGTVRAFSSGDTTVLK